MLQVVSSYEAGLFRGSRPPAGTAATRRSTPVGTSSEGSRPAHASASRQRTSQRIFRRQSSCTRVSITSAHVVAHRSAHLQKTVVLHTRRHRVSTRVGTCFFRRQASCTRVVITSANASASRQHTTRHIFRRRSWSSRCQQMGQYTGRHIFGQQTSSTLISKNV